MKDRLPAEIINRRKKGFGIPIGKWINKELKDFVLDTLSESKIKSEGIFNYDQIKVLLDQHAQGKKDNRKAIWTLVIFESWLKRWV